MNELKPNYYHGDEVFDIMKSFVGDLKGMEPFYWCNVVKYILRFQGKNGLQDLKKAQIYLQKLIDTYEE